MNSISGIMAFGNTPVTPNSISIADKVVSMDNFSFETPYIQDRSASSAVFEDFFDAALDVVNDTNTAQKEADQIALDYMTGKSDDIIAVTSAQSRAERTLSFTVQVTNKIIASYQEIIRLQI